MARVRSIASWMAAGVRHCPSRRSRARRRCCAAAPVCHSIPRPRARRPSALRRARSPYPRGDPRSAELVRLQRGRSGHSVMGTLIARATHSGPPARSLRPRSEQSPSSSSYAAARVCRSFRMAAHESPVPSCPARATRSSRRPRASVLSPKSLPVTQRCRALSIPLPASSRRAVDLRATRRGSVGPSASRFRVGAPFQTRRGFLVPHARPDPWSRPGQAGSRRPLLPTKQGSDWS